MKRRQLQPQNTIHKQDENAIRLPLLELAMS